MELPPVFGVSVFSIEIICDVTLMAHIKVDTQRFKYFLSIFFSPPVEWNTIVLREKG